MRVDSDVENFKDLELIHGRRKDCGCVISNKVDMTFDFVDYEVCIRHLVLKSSSISSFP